MDATENVSPRVLLRRILNTEPPRTPVIRSVPSGQRSNTATRRSSRTSQKPAAQTPQAILRRSLKHKLTESITRKSLPASRRSAAVLARKDHILAPALFDDGETPRHILRNILRTEPVKSPVVHDQGPLQEQNPPSATSSSTSRTRGSRDEQQAEKNGLQRKISQRRKISVEKFNAAVNNDQGPLEEQKPPSATSSTTRTRPSIDLSTLDFPDVTIGNVLSTAKGLSRKRPRRSLNVTDFEKRLRGADESEVRSEESLDEQLSLSSSSFMSLSLKTPLVDVQTEKKGLQRKMSQRRKISVEEFSAAVNIRQTRDVPSVVSKEHSDTIYSDGFTLNLSQVSEPELTTDIVNCNSTQLYPQPNATTSNLSIVATQDKPSVMASQLQADIEQDCAMETEESNPDENAPEDFCQGEEEVTPGEQSARRASRSRGAVDDAGEEEAAGAAPVEPETCFGSTAEDCEGATDSQTDATEPDEEEDAADSQPEEDVDGGSQSDEKVVEVSQSADKKETDAGTDEGAADSEPHGDCQTESETEENDLPGSQSEDEPESQSQEDVEIESRQENLSKSVKEEEEEEGDGGDEESEQQTDSLLQPPLETEHQMLHQLEEDEDQNESQNEDDGEKEDEEQGEPAVEHISRRSRHSQAAAVVAVSETGEDVVDTEAADSKSHRTFDLGSNLDVEEPQSSAASSSNPGQAESSNPGRTDPSRAESESDADVENVHSEERLSGVAPGEAAPEGGDEQEEWEEEDDDDLPPNTPPFVKVKRNFFDRDASVSPVLKNLQASAGNASEAAPAAKPAQARRRRTRPAKKRATLPKSYLMSVFRHFAKAKVSADVYPVLDELMDSFFDRLVADLETYAAHAKRKTIEVEDAVLLLKRQGYVNDKMPVEVLIEKYLRLDQRKLLIPIATSGNVVIPKKR